MTSIFNAPVSSSMARALTELIAIAEIYNDINMYIYFISMLEDPLKHDAFLSMSDEQQADYMCFFYK